MGSVTRFHTQTSYSQRTGQRTPTAGPRDGQPREGECPTPDTPQYHPETGREMQGPGRAPATHNKQSKGLKQETWRGTNRCGRPYQRPARGPRELRAQKDSRRAGDANTAGARAHDHATDTPCAQKRQPDRARRTQIPLRMAYQQARERTSDRAIRYKYREGREGGTVRRGAGRQEAARAWPSLPAASAAQTPTGHCACQGSSGAQRHAPTPQLSSLCASPWGSHWRQASSTGWAVPAPRATMYQVGGVVAKSLQPSC